jgi:hypothetical protein
MRFPRRKTPESRHQKLDVCFSAKNVCLTLNSRRKRGAGFSSAPNPTRTSRLLAKRVDSGNIFNLLGQRMKSGGLGVDYFGIIWA